MLKVGERKKKGIVGFCYPFSTLSVMPYVCEFSFCCGGFTRIVSCPASGHSLLACPWFLAVQTVSYSLSPVSPMPDESSDLPGQLSNLSKFSSLHSSVSTALGAGTA